MASSTNFSNISIDLLNDDADVDPDTDKQDLIIAKVAAILILGIVSFLLGILPTQIKRCFNWDLSKTSGSYGSTIVSMLLCFGGGVLLYTTFLHVQPEVREGFQKLLDSGRLSNYTETIHLSELVFCIGFFLVYLIEESVHAILDRKHTHNEEEAILHRTVSLRKCSRKDGIDNPTLIPRVSLSNQADITSKSISTQILLESSSTSTVADSNTLPDLDYLPKVLDPELVLHYPKVHEVDTPRFSHSRHHSHMVFDNDSQYSSGDQQPKLSKSIAAFCTVLALSFHAIFEGLAVGLEESVKNVWYLTLAVAAHKYVISFSVGLQLVSSKTRMLLIALYVGTFAIVSPIGIGIGIGLSHGTSDNTDLATTILQGMAAGVLLYVVFFEVLQRERANATSGMLQLVSVMAGFGVMFGLQLLTGGHEHSHGDHEHDHEVHEHSHHHH